MDPSVPWSPGASAKKGRVAHGPRDPAINKSPEILFEFLPSLGSVSVFSFFVCLDSRGQKCAKEFLPFKAPPFLLCRLCSPFLLSGIVVIAFALFLFFSQALGILKPFLSVRDSPNVSSSRPRSLPFGFFCRRLLRHGGPVSLSLYLLVVAIAKHADIKDRKGVAYKTAPPFITAIAGIILGMSMGRCPGCPF